VEKQGTEKPKRKGTELKGKKRITLKTFACGGIIGGLSRRDIYEGK